MRIITGSLKGRKLEVPEGAVTRPTTDRVKESMFSMLETRKGLRDMVVLDLFAGSGSLGFEAVSRGASSVTFVEHHPGAGAQLRKTATAFKVEKQVQVISAPVEQFLRQPATKAYDIIFSDPPYEFPFMVAMVETVLTGNWLKPGGWFLLEHDTRHNFTEDPRCVSSRPYGRTIVSVFLTD